MILADLLSRLREADPGCYHAYGVMLATYGIVEGSAMSVAWLQYCLQESIRAWGWAYQVSISFQGTRYGKIVTLNADGSKHFHQDQHADTEAEALLLAYLAAIEVTA